MPHFLAFIVALSISTAAIPLLLRWAAAAGLNDQPGERKVHLAPVPRVGGIAMAAGIIISTALTVHLAPPVVGLLGGMILLLAFGVWDDRKNIDYRLKFIGQFIAIGFCMIVGGARIESLALATRVQLPEAISLTFTFVFLVGVTNAVNLADGLDGLAGGLALLCLCAVALLATVSGNSTVATLAMIEAGAIFGFLRFNTHPARVFMGDGGSQVLGFSIGVLAILATQGETSDLSAALPLLLLGLPILDTLTVMARRISAGRSPFTSDRNHFHHRLLELGFAHHEAVILIYCLQVGLFLLAYFMRFESDLLILATFIAFSIAVHAALYLSARQRWRVHGGQASAVANKISKRVRQPNLSAIIVKASAWTMGLGLVGYAVVVIAETTHVGGDITSLCVAMLALLLVLSRFAAGANSHTWFERPAAYVIVVLLVYLDETATDHSFSALSWVFVGITAAAALARFVFSGTRRFQVTTLDVLIAFIALVVPNLPGFVSLPSDLPTGLIKAVALLYVVEMLDGTGLRRTVPRAFIAVMLSAIALRGLPLLIP